MSTKGSTKPDKQGSIRFIEQSILLLRGRKVLLSTQISDLYDVDTRGLTQAVKRNSDRFPSDFMFQLNADELETLRSQNVILKGGRGQHSKYPLFAFTQEGVAMLSSVLRSKTAIQANIAIMRAFVKLRELMASHAELAKKIDALEKRHDAQFRVVFNSIRELIKASATLETMPARKRRIGFGHE